MCTPLLQLLHHTLPTVSLTAWSIHGEQKTTDHDPYLSHNTKQQSQSETNQLPSQQRQSLVSEQGYLDMKWQPTFLSMLQPRLKAPVAGEQAQSDTAAVTRQTLSSELHNKADLQGENAGQISRPGQEA